MINPYDLGNIELVENAEKVDINELVYEANKQIKENLIRSYVQILDTDIQLTTTQTRFGGERMWFICPICNRRIAVLYKLPTNTIIGCRKCLGLKYKAQRYKGMMELKM